MTSCIVRNTWNFSILPRSCGQCSPCREGTGWMEKVLRIENGHGREEDIDLWSIQVKLKEIRFVH
jgi:NADH-quinone oxidoreductase subunit F